MHGTLCSWTFFSLCVFIGSTRKVLEKENITVSHTSHSTLSLSCIILISYHHTKDIGKYVKIKWKYNKMIGKYSKIK